MINFFQTFKLKDISVMFFIDFAELFHVEQHRMAIFLIFSVFLLGCEKREPTPELKDPIYLDIRTQQGLAEKAVAASNAKIAELKGELSAALPQTGQIKLLQRRIFQFEKERDIYQQQVKYWIIRLEDRAKQARIDYNKAYVDKKPWPNPKEYEVYLSEKKLRLAKIEWDAKQRLEDYKSDLKPKSGVSQGGH